MLFAFRDSRFGLQRVCSESASNLRAALPDRRVIGTSTVTDEGVEAPVLKVARALRELPKEPEATGGVREPSFVLTKVSGWWPRGQLVAVGKRATSNAQPTAGSSAGA